MELQVLVYTPRLGSTYPYAVRFLKAGANVIKTNTYQAHVEGFMKTFGLSVEESLELIGKAVDICKTTVLDYSHNIKEDVQNRPIFVAGSVGSFGASRKMDYSGEYLRTISTEELKNWHRPRIQQLSSSQVDILALETIPGKLEITALIELLREFPSTKAWISFSTHDGMHLCDGTLIEEIPLLVNRCDQVLGVGVNCVCPRECIASILQVISSGLQPNKAVICYPNSFELWSPENGWIEASENLRDYSSSCAKWIEAGANWIGGCCRVTPDIIKEMASVMNTLNAVKESTT